MLLPLTRFFGRLPGGASAAFARLLDRARWPFHLVNYLGSCAGARLIPPARMGSTLDAVIRALESRLERETGTGLHRSMHYPMTWDPLFARTMTLGELYRYPTRHFWHHRQQLTLPEGIR
jgi:hypothetical protein